MERFAKIIEIADHQFLVTLGFNDEGEQTVEIDTKLDIGRVSYALSGFAEGGAQAAFDNFNLDEETAKELLVQLNPFKNLGGAK